MDTQEHLDEHVLGQILNILTIVKEPADKPKYHRGEGFDDGLLCRSISLLGANNEFAASIRHRQSLPSIFTAVQELGAAA